MREPFTGPSKPHAIIFENACLRIRIDMITSRPFPMNRSPKTNQTKSISLLGNMAAAWCGDVFSYRNTKHVIRLESGGKDEF